jgi:serine/threonine protein kinase
MLNQSQFVEFVSTFGLITAEDLAAVEEHLGPGSNADDAHAIAHLLVERQKLTKYQAAAIYQGKGKSLVYGEYLVLDRIGAGGMGQVYKARHRRMDRIVALKVLSTSAMKNADAVRRFEREVRAAARLMHPNIVAALDAGEQEGVHYLVMEFVDGPDLSSVLKTGGKLNVKQACVVVAQAARGLAFAHSKGVVHRDIKPGNLLVDHEGAVKVLDMGLARFDDGAPGNVVPEGELTQNGTLMGTLDYLAPEQALDTTHADAKSDVYSLGCTLYRLLTGEPVYGGRTMVEKILAHRDQPIPSLRLSLPDAPPPLELLVTRMLAKKPADRPTMQEVAESVADIASGRLIYSDLSGVAEDSAVPSGSAGGLSFDFSPGPVGAASRTKATAPRRRTSKLPLVATAAAAAMTAAFGGWMYWGDKSGEPVASSDSLRTASPGDAPQAATTPTPSTTVPTATPSDTRLVLHLLKPAGLSADPTPATDLLVTAPQATSSTTVAVAPTRMLGATAPTFSADTATPPAATPAAATPEPPRSAMPAPRVTAAIGLPATLPSTSGVSPTPAVTIPAPAGVTAAADPRAPVPTDEGRRAAVQLIKKVYHDEYAAARTPAKKAELSKKLFKQSQEAADAAERYVLLEEAVTLGAEGAEVDAARQAINELVDRFQVATSTTCLDGWRAIFVRPRPPEEVRVLLGDVNDRFDAAVKTANFDEAKAIGEFALATAQRLRDVAEIKLARDRNTELAARRTEHAAAVAAWEKRAIAPDDPETNLTIGRYRALVEKDWATALPLLARGSDPLWKDLVAKTLAAGDDPAALASAADAWWDAASAKPNQKAELTAAALAWYEKTVGSLTGLQKTRVENRITEGRLIAPESRIPITPLMPANESVVIAAAGPSDDGMPKAVEAPTPPPVMPRNSQAAGNATATTPRMIAERIIARRGTVRVVDAGGLEKDAKSTTDLPAGDFDILKIIYGDAADIGDADLAAFVQLKRLEHVDLKNSQISGAGLAYLRDLPALYRIEIHHCPLTDSGLANLSTMTRLTVLAVYETAVTDAGMVHLRNLRQLKYLNLSRTSLTDAGLAQVVQLSNLDNLQLDHTRVTDAGIELLAQHPRLGVLSLRGVRLTDRGAAALAKMKTLKELLLSTTDASPAALQLLRERLPQTTIRNLD